jgi:sugar lactone lactonase YvrE
MNTTAKFSFSVLLLAVAASASFADTTQTTVTTTTTAPAPVITVRDGFTENYSQVYVTRNGSTKLVNDNMKLANGIVVRPDGTVIVPNKMNRSMHSGDWLTFDGTLTRADSGKVEHLIPVQLGDRPTT